MTDDRIEYVELDHGVIIKAPRSIKTRSSSFENIRSFYINALKKKLEKKIRSSLTQGYTNDNFERKITRTANSIAKLEERIMLLSKEDVPKNYVSKRAIKLRKSMISNLTYNSDGLYSVGLENRNTVFGEGIEDSPKAPVKTPVERVMPYDDKLSTVVEEPIPYDEKLSTVVEHPMPYNERLSTVVERPMPYNERLSTVVERPMPYNDRLSTVIERPMPYNERLSTVKPGVLAAAIPSGAPTDRIDVVPSTLERQAIVDAVNSSFERVEADNVGTIGSPEIVEVINDSLERTDGHSPRISRDEIRSVVNDAFQSVDARGAEAINSEVDKAIQRLRVTRNNSGAVRSQQFDENGYRRVRRKKYNYKPMTDEEIRASQIKLGFDEHGNLIDNGKRVQEPVVSTAKIVGSFVAPGATLPSLTLDDVFVPTTQKKREAQVRDIPVVARDRDETAIGLDLEDGKSLFEVIDQEENAPVTSSVAADESSMSVEDYQALKEKILYLQQQRQITHQQSVDAQRAAQASAIEAQEARRQFEISQANYNDRMKKLRAYTASLEAACTENIRVAAQAEQDARNNNSYVQSQRKLADKNNRIIGEIDSMMAQSEPSQETTALSTVVRR